MDQIIGILLGGFLAIAGGIAGSVVPIVLQNRRERRALAYSLAGEISSLIEVAEQRKYEQSIEAIIQNVKTTKQPWFVTVRIEQHYFTVYEANANKIGLLPKETARNVAKFYTYAKSFIEDVTDKSFSPKSEEESIQRLSGALHILRLCQECGRNAVKELESVDC
jgi:hypothetical protein